MESVRELLSLAIVSMEAPVLATQASVNVLDISLGITVKLVLYIIALHVYSINIGAKLYARRRCREVRLLNDY